MYESRRFTWESYRRLTLMHRNLILYDSPLERGDVRGV